MSAQHGLCCQCPLTDSKIYVAMLTEALRQGLPKHYPDNLLTVDRRQLMGVFGWTPTKFVWSMYEHGTRLFTARWNDPSGWNEQMGLLRSHWENNHKTARLYTAKWDTLTYCTIDEALAFMDEERIQAEKNAEHTPYIPNATH